MVVMVVGGGEEPWGAIGVADGDGSVRKETCSRDSIHDEPAEK